MHACVLVHVPRGSRLKNLMDPFLWTDDPPETGPDIRKYDYYGLKPNWFSPGKGAIRVKNASDADRGYALLVSGQWLEGPIQYAVRLSALPPNDLLVAVDYHI